jgi:outer membrane protein OmpA-like peptidoglycan-associated protein
MSSVIRQWSVFGVAMLAGMMIVSGCATKKYVREQVQTVQPSIQEAQNGVKENAERIDAVDKKAQQGISTAQAAAQAADTKATQAGQAAQTAQNAAQAADRKADTANQGVQQANNRIGTLETRVTNMDNYTPGETQTVTFPLNSAVLNDQAKGTLDRIASDLSGQRSGYMVQIQGYTDGTGAEQYNIGLSQRRAEAVERYLVSKQVPLFRIAIVGLGKDNPVADNKTRDGRAQNRRVEIQVLKSGGNRQTN